MDTSSEYVKLSHSDKPVTSRAEAKDILNTAIGEMIEREKTYDSPGGERSMEKTVALFNILTGSKLTTEQGWKFMILLKLVRSVQGGFKLDNYVDGAAYFSLAGEEGQRQRE